MTVSQWATSPIAKVTLDLQCCVMDFIFFFPSMFLQHLLCSHSYKQGIFAFSVTPLALMAVAHTEQKRLYSRRDLCSLQENVASHGVHNSYSCFQEGMK